MNCIEIDGKKIGEHFKPYLVAEVSGNHNGSIEKAKRIITAAKENGADAVKLQTYTADTITIKSDRDEFKVNGGSWDGYYLYDLYKWAETPFEWHDALFQHARDIGITIFSTPFDETAVDLLESLDAPAYKIASFELVDLPLIKKVARTGKPMIMSTGMANEREIKEAVDTAKSNGCSELVLLHCISSYPAPIEQSNLRTIPELANKFSVLSGLSDHTLGLTAAVTSTGLGASFIEKHFTLSRQDEGPDREFSIEPQELRCLSQSINDAWLALGDADLGFRESESANMQFRRSLYFVNGLKKGDVISKKDIRSIRPGLGLDPKHLEYVLGKTVIEDVPYGTPVSFDLVDGE